MQNKVILGIDIAKDKFDVALLTNAKYRTKIFRNNPKGFAGLMVWLNKYTSQQVHACLEATGTYGDNLSNYLFDKNIIVSIINPAKIKGFAQSELSRTKTDKSDAKLISRFCWAMNPAPWKPHPIEIRNLRSLVKRLESLMSIRLEEQNRLESAAPIVKRSIEKLIAVLEVEIEEVKATIKNNIEISPNLKEQQKLLDTIPGVGPATIAQILSMMCTPERFKTAKHLVAFVGLNPKHRQSGSSVQGRSRISKTGDSVLRKSLYMPAIVAKEYNPSLKALYDRLLAAGKPKMLAICAVMRKLLHIIYGVLKSGLPFDANYEVNKKNLAVT